MTRTAPTHERVILTRSPRPDGMPPHVQDTLSEGQARVRSAGPFSCRRSP